MEPAGPCGGRDGQMTAPDSLPRSEYRELVGRLAEIDLPLKLSRPALETLALIAYCQPVTTADIRAVRGIQDLSVIETLLDRDLIMVAGHKRAAGRPRLYRTTKEFLRRYGLRDLSELPTVPEFASIANLAKLAGDTDLIS